MSDRILLELLASCEGVLDAGSRSVAIARALAEGLRSGLRPPDDVLDAYVARLERDEAQLQELRRRVGLLKDPVGR